MEQRELGTSGLRVPVVTIDARVVCEASLDRRERDPSIGDHVCTGAGKRKGKRQAHPPGADHCDFHVCITFYCEKIRDSS